MRPTFFHTFPKGTVFGKLKLIISFLEFNYCLSKILIFLFSLR